MLTRKPRQPTARPCHRRSQRRFDDRLGIVVRPGEEPGSARPALAVPTAGLVGKAGVISLVPRVRATANPVRDFCALDASLQDMAIKIVRTLASSQRRSR